ncbi:MAG: hypothetical protein OXT67_09095 [Zetaproteobacteria bacterium]|nr:hypothetical protein [Zetaproteobacteria bacterium]
MTGSLRYTVLALMLLSSCASRRATPLVRSATPAAQELRTYNSRYDAVQRSPLISRQVAQVAVLARRMSAQIVTLSREIYPQQPKFSLAAMDGDLEDKNVITYASQLQENDLVHFVFSDEFDAVMINEKIGSSYTFVPGDESSTGTSFIGDPDLASRALMIGGGLAVAQSVLIFGQPFGYAKVRATAQLVLGAILFWYGVRTADGAYSSEDVQAVPIVLVLTALVKSVNLGYGIHRSLNMIRDRYDPDTVESVRRRANGQLAPEQLESKNVGNFLNVHNLKKQYQHDPQLLQRHQRRFDVMVADDTIRSNYQNGSWRHLEKIGVTPPKLKKMVGGIGLISALIGSGYTFQQLYSGSQALSLTEESKRQRVQALWRQLEQTARALIVQKHQLIGLVARASAG